MHRLDKETTSVSDECGFGTSHVWLGDCCYTGSHSPSIPTSPKTCTGTVCKVSRITTHTHTMFSPQFQPLTTSTVKSGIGMAMKSSVISGKAKVKCRHDIPICCHGNLKINLQANIWALKQDLKKKKNCYKSEKPKKTHLGTPVRDHSMFLDHKIWGKAL